ncbi:MAG: ABC transporter ATP-binding protein [Pseudomonadales bacterium]|jgi:ABC-type multidrug transport system fused ATPase/permease subunit|nr:ABC transporter ATP-binding protein [Pseudomonadales bacterium]
MGQGSLFPGIRAFIQQSITGVRVGSEQLREIDPDRIQFQDVIALFVRTWPYVHPMRWHAVAYVGFAVFQFLWMTMFAFINFGLIYNNVLLDLPVAAISAILLFLDPSQWVDVEELTREQRIVLVPRVVVFGILAVALSNTVGNANAYYRVWILQNINQNLRLRLMSQLQALSLKFHAESKTGDAIYRLFQDSAMVTQILQALLVDPFLACVRFFLGLAVVAAFSPLLSLMLLLTWGPMLCLGQRMSAPLRRGFKEARARNSALTSTIQESIEGIRTIKVNGLEEQRQALFEQHSQGAFAASHDARVRLLLFGFYAFVCAAVPLVIIELQAALFAYEGTETFLKNLLLSFGFAVWNLGGQDQARGRARQAVGSVEALLNLWGRAQDMAMGLNRVYQILDLTPDIQNREDAEELTSVQESIRFTELQFSYPERELFSDVSFEARVGEICAILGPTGSGKSTLMLLLLRMFEFQAGRIELDGSDIRDFTFQSIRRNITLATQENILFSMSVLENIRYARPDASDEEVREAARIACADDFINNLVEGYSTFLGEKAAKLSTGQRQRLVIARAILKDTPILILDEPTASLDAGTERQIMTNIRSWAMHRTVFVITHRLSTVREADRIVFLKDGRIADVGSHTELMARPSAYRDFVEAELSSRVTA